MKYVKFLRIVNLFLVVLLLVLQGTNSAYSATKDWKEGETYNWGFYATLSQVCDQDGQETSTDSTIESIQYQTIHKIDETSQTVNVSMLPSIGSSEIAYEDYSYNASNFGGNLANLFGGEYYLEANTGKFIDPYLYGGIGGTGGFFGGEGGNFVDPQWDIFNTELKDVFNTSNIIGTARNLTSGFNTSNITWNLTSGFNTSNIAWNLTSESYETSQTVNVNMLPSIGSSEIAYSYHASNFGSNLANLFGGEYYLEANTGKFIVTYLYGGIGGFFGGEGGNFVDPQWDIINTELRDAFNTSNIIGTARNLTSESYGPYYYYDFTLADILGNATSYKLMGQDNWDDGLEKLTDSTRSWSLEFDFTGMARQSEWDSATQNYDYSTAFELYKFKTETSFNNEGVVESAKSELETKITNDENDITCTVKTIAEVKLGGLPASGAPGFELISVLALLGTLTIIIKRKRR
ncbi:MAG: Heimdall-CTERM domain-containing surface protein [Candidatus Hodarchaeales archaeon]|jgi:hypothetical protein